jgi:hypothetical protein
MLSGALLRRKLGPDTEPTLKLSICFFASFSAAKPVEAISRKVMKHTKNGIDLRIRIRNDLPHFSCGAGIPLTEISRISAPT